MTEEQLVQDYTAAELSVLFRVHVTTIRRWISAGQLGAIRLPGGMYRIPSAEVDRIRQIGQEIGSI